MGDYQIEFLPTAQKELASLPRVVQERIAAKLDQLKSNPGMAGVKVLKNSGGLLRLRVVGLTHFDVFVGAPRPQKRPKL